MSYPLYLLSCCHGDSDKHLTNSTISQDHLIFTDTLTNSFCIITSAVSLFGVFYLLLPRNNLDLSTPLKNTRILTGPSLKSTVLSLFAADVLASLGILLRSSVWLAGYPVPAEHNPGSQTDNSHVFCIIVNLWIQYFYLCTYFWNLNFGLELYSSVRNTKNVAWPKYVIGWIIPAVLCSAAGVVTYYPSLYNCYGTRTLEWSMLFLIIFVPIFLVIIVNPVLFFISSKSIRRQLISHTGRFTHAERDLVEAVRAKLTIIFIVFAFCWVPNIIAAVLEAIPGEDLTYFVILEVLWILMAICNPIQALLNCLAYYGNPGWRNSCDVLSSWCCRKRSISIQESSALFTSSPESEADETSHLLAWRGYCSNSDS